MAAKEMKYPLTPELRVYIKKTRNFLNISTEELSNALGMNKETYNNIEKMQSRTKMISRVLLEKIFEVFKMHTPSEQYWTLEESIKGHLEKFMFNADTNKATLENQHWLKALFLRYDILDLSETTKKALLPYSNLELSEMLHNLSNNKHIKLKTDIVLENEIYVNLNEKKYPPLGGYPFWCIKYSEFSEQEIDLIIDKIEKGTIHYSLLFSLLVNEELNSRRQKDYNDIYSTVYNKLNFYKYRNIFDRIKDIITPKQKETLEINSDFLDILEKLDISEYSEGTQQLIVNCLKGGNTFINSINIDFSPVYNASKYDFEVFKIRLRELIDNIK